MQKILTVITDILLKGKIPFISLDTIKKILLSASLVPIVGIYFFPEDFRGLGELSWKILLVILALRPASQIFVDFKILKTLLPLRKELGIFCGSLGIAHSIGYFLNAEISLPAGFLDPQIWDVSQNYFWGMIGFLIAVILTLTSNIFSMKLLQKYWKKLHKLTYLFFGVIVVHIVLIRIVREGEIWNMEIWEPVIPSIALIILWTLASMKIKISFLKFFQ